MTEFPKTGQWFVIESIDREIFRWEKYKPDGARQMGVPGRWQKQIWRGDFFKWENCEVPQGVFVGTDLTAPGPAQRALDAMEKFVTARLRIKRETENYGADVVPFSAVSEANNDFHQLVYEIVGVAAGIIEPVEKEPKAIVRLWSEQSPDPVQTHGGLAVATYWHLEVQGVEIAFETARRQWDTNLSQRQRYTLLEYAPSHTRGLFDKLTEAFKQKENTN